ncbi:MAG: M13 family metallopeptidase [Rikenellaceae bacterium]|nr:M13 family metallopeptidase [Rikenellaceae bacterium]
MALLAMTGCGTDSSQPQSAGILLENLDTTALPGTDFYQFATGGWSAAHPLTDEYSRFGSFDQLAENNREQLNELIGEIATRSNAPGTISYKIATIYNQVIDSVKRNADGVEPIRAQLARIAALESPEDVKAYLAATAPEGFSAYFGFYVGADEMNSAMNIINLYQGGVGMGNRDYYLDQDEHSQELRAKYLEHIEKMFALAGFSAEEAAAKAGKIMRIETDLAEVLYDRIKLRDPQANYNKMTIDQLQENISGLNWSWYFTELGAPGVQEVVVGQVEPIRFAVQQINTLPMDAQIAYLEWKLINRSADYLNDAMEEQDFDFYSKTLSGVQSMQPLWKRAVSAVNGFLGEAVGQMYVEKYFPPAAKQRMLHLVDNLKEALGDRISQLDWMSDQTKAKAHEKLSTFYVKIGYPDKWKDYSSLDIQPDSYWNNVLRASRFYFEEMMDKVGKPVDKDEWHMTPQTVNAYYNPTTNEICFPAGILQYPFFDMQADDAFNYGAIGVVIGHEMTHGFDDQGRQYDKDGNMNDWWTAADAEQFEARADKLAEFFNNIEVLPGLYANGRFTLGENIADQGGLVVSYEAFKKATRDNPLPEKEGFTPEQRFFLAYAGVWAGNIRDEEIRRLTMIDPHSLGKWRVDVTLPHVAPWYDAFDITPEDPMYITPQERAVVWWQNF